VEHYNSGIKRNAWKPVTAYSQSCWQATQSSLHDLEPAMEETKNLSEDIRVRRTTDLTSIWNSKIENSKI
jgi:hypothetical protein